MGRGGIDRVLYQIMDANANRASEGLRVCEEYFRYVRRSPKLTRRFKLFRHEVAKGLTRVDRGVWKQARDSDSDLGRAMHTKREFSRASYRDILQANLQRVGEALRVLEEFSKMRAPKGAAHWKGLRFRFYDLDRDADKAS